jgi:hypothetical protein
MFSGISGAAAEFTVATEGERVEDVNNSKNNSNKSNLHSRIGGMVAILQFHSIFLLSLVFTRM